MLLDAGSLQTKGAYSPLAPAYGEGRPLTNINEALLHVTAAGGGGACARKPRKKESKQINNMLRLNQRRVGAIPAHAIAL